MIDSSSGERTSSFQSPTIIAIIPISNLPFPVLAVALAYGPEQVFIGDSVFPCHITSVNGQFKEYKTEEGGPINNAAKVSKILQYSNYYLLFFFLKIIFFKPFGIYS